MVLVITLNQLRNCQGPLVVLDAKHDCMAEELKEFLKELVCSVLDTGKPQPDRTHLVIKDILGKDLYLFQ